METVNLSVHATPKSSKNAFMGWRDGVLCLKITAPPVEGAANEAIIKFLAKELKIKKSQITLAKGEKSREKRFELTGISPEDIYKIFPK